jgi:hypothetical protein
MAIEEKASQIITDIVNATWAIVSARFEQLIQNLVTGKAQLCAESQLDADFSSFQPLIRSYKYRTYPRLFFRD